ncbi:hypothetical protein DPEC_G00140180 [Dallia pectoralis]|uniref:Uncharacterized protein n=1 Tax=Dallia pectoralis TaxID=75939 RepID=A0ACC2GME8_DALPE|nr:hypothetical protein DPEC_G00140180 [Dallia pectoralis]
MCSVSSPMGPEDVDRLVRGVNTDKTNEMSLVDHRKSPSARHAADTQKVNLILDSVLLVRSEEHNTVPIC